MPRPTRLIAPDFDGAPRSLPDNPESWRLIGGPDRGSILLLGAGPASPPRFALASPWLESPLIKKLYARLGAKPAANPALEITPRETIELAASSRVYFYWPGLALDPDFWGPLLAQIRLAQNPPAPAPTHAAWLPGSDDLLLHRELKNALGSSGFASVDEKLNPAWDRPPAFALSVNFRGLDSEGETFYRLQSLNAPLAIWLVDNPWHLLSRVKYPWWREAALFVTDKSFIPELKKYGAKRVYFCPLAVAPHFWRQPRAPFEPPTFVGRLAFPDKKAFFGASAPPPTLLREAEDLTAAGRPPDYHWWVTKTGAKLWPGLKGRVAGAGADEISARSRVRWVHGAAPLRIIGDSAWEGAGFAVEPPRDYCGSLGDVYAASQAILNVTSLLLPHSLNQRHFDVWAAGGLLLSDPTPGLEIFPKELTAPITLNSPEAFRGKLAAFAAKPAARAELIDAWQRHLRKEHSYEARIERIRKILSSREENTP